MTIENSHAWLMSFIRRVIRIKKVQTQLERALFSSQASSYLRRQYKQVALKQESANPIDRNTKDSNAVHVHLHSLEYRR